MRWPPKKDSAVTEEKLELEEDRMRRLKLMARLNERRCNTTPMYGKDFHYNAKIFRPNIKYGSWSAGRIHCLNTLFEINESETSHCLQDMLYTPERRIQQLSELFDRYVVRHGITIYGVCQLFAFRFIVYVPAVRAPEPDLRMWHPSPSRYWGEKREAAKINTILSKSVTPIHRISSAMMTQFPDARLIQYDCGGHLFGFAFCYMYLNVVFLFFR